MELNFYKYQGTGNDFIMVDNRSNLFTEADYGNVKRLCDRRTGIGADGFILLQNHPDFDFEMVYFNADGRLGSMCGNGGRCVVRFAKQLGVIQDVAYFLAADGDHHASVEGNLIHLRMNDVHQIENTGNDYFLNTGSPHYIQFVDDVEKLNVFESGRSIRYNDRFAAEGTNVNFVQKQPDNSIFVRTYERGVENETYSCGTGVTAAALANYVKHGGESPLRIRTLGGELQVAFEQEGDSFTDIYLIGPAEKVFRGTVNI
ncbi:MAG: diaminopimelate epimerase [Hymenobacteraceae bacterium]|nr:diaminopimelate epimerase [Hymenobacteraceae bacterium]MDX5397196.1 diaminopimelate epimerase [Hymenobacteraceae bacterium]MDX5513272.1 diaminopimelate epimerase [Hymenobacteraceae bacterium]